MKVCERCDREALAGGRWCLTDFRAYVAQAREARHRAELLAARERGWSLTVGEGRFVDRLGRNRPTTRRRVPECGTDSGYQGHRRRGQQPCWRCKQAHAAAERQRQNRSAA